MRQQHVCETCMGSGMVPSRLRWTSVDDDGACLRCQGTGRDWGGLSPEDAVAERVDAQIDTIEIERECPW